MRSRILPPSQRTPCPTIPINPLENKPYRSPSSCQNRPIQRGWVADWLLVSAAFASAVQLWLLPASVFIPPYFSYLLLAIAFSAFALSRWRERGSAEPWIELKSLLREEAAHGLVVGLVLTPLVFSSMLTLHSKYSPQEVWSNAWCLSQSPPMTCPSSDRTSLQGTLALALAASLASSCSFLLQLALLGCPGLVGLSRVLPRIAVNLLTVSLTTLLAHTLDAHHAAGWTVTWTLTTVVWGGSELASLFLKLLPRAFTLGEVLVVSSLFAFLGANIVPVFTTFASWTPLIRTMSVPSQVAQTAVFVAFVSILLFASVCRLLRVGARTGYLMLATLTFGVVYPSVWTVGGTEPLTFIWRFVLCPHQTDDNSFQRVYCSNALLGLPQPLLWCVFWLAVLVLGLFVLPQLWFFRLAPSERPHQIVLRKYFHGLAVLLFLPACFCQPRLTGFALACAFALFMLAEFARVTELPPLAQIMDRFMATFLDSRDRGLVVVSHTYLLVGLALPLWLHLPFVELEAQRGCRSSPTLATAAVGVVALGVSDSVASLVGCLFGSIHWASPHNILCRPKGHVAVNPKTLEGTVAAVFSGVLTYLVLFAVWPGTAGAAFPVTLTALVGMATVSFLLEAYTTQNDNLVVPLFAYAVMLIFESL